VQYPNSLPFNAVSGGYTLVSGVYRQVTPKHFSSLVKTKGAYKHVDMHGSRCTN
jgi:hypothetical protein